MIAPIDESVWDIQSGTWLELLANVTDLRIRIELVGNQGGPADIGGMDNVVLDSFDLPPGDFELLCPLNVASELPLPSEPRWECATARFQWTASYGKSVAYEFRLSDEAGMENIIHSVTGIGDLEYTIPEGILSYGTQYWWTVIAHAQSGSTVPHPESVYTFSIREPADLNNDGVVDGLDLAFLLGAWSE